MRKGGNTNSRIEGQDRCRLGQTMSVGRNEEQERTHGVYKKETQEGNWKFGRRRDWCVCGLTRVEKIKVLDWGRTEMVVNSCLDLEERMRLKRMWTLVPQVGQKRNK